MAVNKEYDMLVRLLLEKGVDPNIRDDSGATLLYRAASYRNLVILRLLLDAGVDSSHAN
jgi:ankyrin repeat protein